MFPKQHIILNFFISLPLLFFIKPLYVIIFFFSSFLIDIDHYLYYIAEKKTLSLKKAYNWFMVKDYRWKKLSTEERRKHTYALLIFHGAEILIILFLLSKFFYPLFFVFLGFLVHLIEDIIEGVSLGVIERKLFLIFSIYIHITKPKFYSD